jgi:hypothetical protein
MPLLLSAFLAQAISTALVPSLGYQSFEVHPHSPLVIDFSGGSFRTVYYWEGDGDDDPTVVISCRLWDVQYTYRPTLVNAAFPVGDIISLATDALIRLQVWVIPIGFCSPITHYYSIAHSFSDEFTLAENISNLCLFFENPSRDTKISAEILSKRVNFSESRIEIWDSDLARVPCSKSQCDAQLHSKFFIRIVGARTGLRVALRGEFQRHELATVCTRDSVTVWDANLSYSASLATTAEKFWCDDSYAEKREKERLLLEIVVALVVLGIAGLWFFVIRKSSLFGHVPAMLQAEKESRKVQLL